MTAILIGGEKGGTGKSTLATNLAIMASIMGKDVLLLDTDKQATSSRFITKRNEKSITPTPSCVQLQGKYLHKEIEDLIKRYKIIIIDAGGQDSMELRASMASPSVSKMYIPLQCSEFDLETIGKMDELISLALSYNSNLKAHLLFNQAPTHSKIKLLEESLEYVKELENINILDIYISHRVSFKYAAGDCMSVVELELDRIKAVPPYQAKRYVPKASMEMSIFYKEVFNEEFQSEINNYFTKEESIKECIL